jgi:hypothetical protein
MRTRERTRENEEQTSQLVPTIEGLEVSDAVNSCRRRKEKQTAGEGKRRRRRGRESCGRKEEEASWVNTTTET